MTWESRADHMSWFNGEAVISTGARFQLSTVPLPKKTTVNFKMQILVRQRQKLQSETQFLGCKCIFYLFPKAGVIQSVKSIEGADIVGERGKHRRPRRWRSSALISLRTLQRSLVEDFLCWWWISGSGGGFSRQLY